MAQTKTGNKRICIVEGCDKLVRAMNVCGTHYMQIRRGVRSEDGILLRPLREKRPPVCKIEDCERKVTGRGFCSKHYQQWLCGHRSLEGDILTDFKERNTGPISLTDRRRGRGASSGSCKLCGKSIFHTRSGLCGTHYSRYRRGLIDLEGNALRPMRRTLNYGDNVIVISDGASQKKSNSTKERAIQVLSNLKHNDQKAYRDVLRIVKKHK